MEARTLDRFEALLPPGQVWFTPAQAAAVLGRTAQFVRNLIEDGRLPGHLFESRPVNSRHGRTYFFVHRDALLLYLMETATYLPEDFLDRLLEVVRRRPPGELAEIRAETEALLEAPRRAS